MRGDSWSEDEIKILCEGMAEGKTFRQIKKKLPKRTVNACIGKFHRIAEMMEQAQIEQQMMREAA